MKRYTYILTIIALLFVPSASHAADSLRSTKSVRIASEPRTQDVPASAPHADVIQEDTLENTTTDTAYVENELLITFDDWAPADSIAETITALSGDIVEFDSVRKTAHIRIDADAFRAKRTQRTQQEQRHTYFDNIDETLADAVAFALEGSHVTYAEPNYIAQALGTPNDPYYKYQWNFPLINVDDAWDTSTGDNVVVAIVDSGVAYTNAGWYLQAPDLAETSFAEGYNAIDNSSSPFDDNGHGTHLAGIVAGSTNNGLGVAGIAPGATIMPVKVLNAQGDGTYADIVEGIYWAVDHGADIINLSLGGSAYSSILEDAVKYAYDHNVVVTAASGNSGGGTLLYPAAFNNYVISVGAVQYDTQRASYSNYGTGLTLMAPGGNTNVDQNHDGNPDGILQQTLKRSGTYVYPNRFSYYFYRGTSVASPHVAGVAALVKSVGVTNVDDIRNILTSTARDLDSTGYDTVTGYGLVDAHAAVVAAQKRLSTTSSVSSGQATDDTQQTTDNDQPTTSGTNPGEQPTSSETPTTEETTGSPEQEQGVLELDVSTYNMFGRKDTRFAFWEKAYVGINLTDTMGSPVAGATLTFGLTDMSGHVTSLGSYASDADGELWAELGNFSRGTYDLVVTAVKDGFKEIAETVQFRFR